MAARTFVRDTSAPSALDLDEVSRFSGGGGFVGP